MSDPRRTVRTSRSSAPGRSCRQALVRTPRGDTAVRVRRTVDSGGCGSVEGGDRRQRKRTLGTEGTVVCHMKGVSKVKVRSKLVTKLSIGWWLLPCGARVDMFCATTVDSMQPEKSRLLFGMLSSVEAICGSGGVDCQTGARGNKQILDGPLLLVDSYEGSPSTNQ